MNKNEKYHGTPMASRSVISKPLSAFKARLGKKSMRYLPATVIVFGFALVGVILTVASHAATSSATKEAESGVIAGAAGPIADATAAKASGTSYVKFGTAAATPPPPAGTPPPTTPVPNGGIAGPWTVTFDDEFNGTALDTSAWKADTQPGNNSDETSCFDPSTITESGGFLNMALNATPCQGKQYMGGQIETTKFAQAYGFYEARMNMLGSGGRTYNFPAFWLVPSSKCWPTGGEMDIMETIGGGAEASYGNGSSCDNVSNGWPHAIPNGGDWTGWHTFAVDWETSGFTVYYDGKKVSNTITQGGVSSTPMNILLDQDSRPMGGATHTGVMQVDYVRAWKKG